MKFFRHYVFTWWQVALLKLNMVLIGGIIGSYFINFFRLNLLWLILIIIPVSLYLSIISFSKHKVTFRDRLNKLFNRQ